MRWLICTALFLHISIYTRAEDRTSTNWPVIIQEFRESCYNFRDGVDLRENRRIEWVYVTVDVPKGERLPMPDAVSRIMKKEFQSGEDIAKGISDVMCPPIIGEWAMFDNKGRSICLLTMEASGIFYVGGLECVDTGRIYQCSSNEYWRGSFVSEELRRVLLGDPKLFIDQNKTNSAHWRSMVRPLLPVYRTNSVKSPQGQKALRVKPEWR